MKTANRSTARQEKSRPGAGKQGGISTPLMLSSLASFVSVGVALALLTFFTSDSSGQLLALLFYSLLLLLLWHGLPRMPRRSRFGWANTVTLLRASWLCLLLAEGVLLGLESSSARFWSDSRWLAFLALAFLLLDGLDGWLARRRQAETTFGARFDMEVDGLFVLTLSLLLLLDERAGAWIVLAGASRYLFQLGGWLWPWMAALLPSHRRRKMVFVFVSLALIAGLWPGWSQPMGQAIVISALLFFALSLGTDLLWLLRQRGR